jgi:serine/threonine protein kinase
MNDLQNYKPQFFDLAAGIGPKRASPLFSAVTFYLIGASIWRITSLPMGDKMPTTNPGLPEKAEKDASSDLAGGFLVGGGRFSLLRELGRGGMGVVWLAHDERLMASVALKFLPEAVRANPVALNDLRLETKKSRILSHPNIIRIYDLYEAPGEAAFISMEYVEGPSLWTLRMRQPKRCFPWDYLKPIVRQLCEALDYAHGERVIHRDLKPANMLLDKRQRLRLADFGIAARDFEPVSCNTGRHRASGTLSYMSPQQIEGGAARVTDDIYALGATLYELLSGQPPFYQNDIAYQVRHVLATPLSERLADFEVENEVPPAVAAMIMACLSKDPDKRPQSARAVAECIGLSDSTALPATSVAAPVLAAPPSVGENVARRRVALMAGCAGLGVLAWLAWGHFIPKMPDSSAPVSTHETNAGNAASIPVSALTPAQPLRATSVSIELGGVNREKGLREVTGVEDGETAPASIGGKECRHLESRSRARCYFQILPAFKRSGVMNVRIQVEYYAESSGVMQIQFDGSAPGQPLHYTGGGRVIFGGDGGWQIANYQINDALFQNGERGGADFRLSTMCEDLYIHSVTVFFDN